MKCIFVIIVVIVYFIFILYKKYNNKVVNKNKLNHVESSYIIEFSLYFEKYNKDRVVYSGEYMYKLMDNDTIEEINKKINSRDILNYITDKQLLDMVVNVEFKLSKNGKCRVFIRTNVELEKDEDLANIFNYLIVYINREIVNTNVIINQEKYKIIIKTNNGVLPVENVEIKLFQELAKKIKNKTKKECYKVVLLKAKPKLKDSKLGGIPYMPVNEDYPLDKNGNPMFMLLQLNLKDIKLDNYPNDGFLQIYIGSLFFGEEGLEYKVVYYKDDLEYKKEFPEVSEEKLGEFAISRPYKLKFVKTIDYMYESDKNYYSVCYDLIKEIYDFDIYNEKDLINCLGSVYNVYLDELVHENKNFITIGGYPDFAQYDVRENENEDKTECIFKLDSEYDLEKFSLGDYGVILALISEKDLKNKKFDNAYVSFDCM